MAICADTSEGGFLYLTETPVKECNSYVIQTTSEYMQEHVQIETSLISGIFFFSFGLVLLSYKSAWIVGVIKNTVNKI